jgi:hypothetical protein
MPKETGGRVPAQALSHVTAPIAEALDLFRLSEAVTRSEDFLAALGSRSKAINQAQPVYFQSDSQIDLNLQSLFSRLPYWMAIIVVSLTGISLMIDVDQVWLRTNVIPGAQLFKLDAEGNIPNCYAAFSWLVCSILAGLFGLLSAANSLVRRSWVLLATLFALLGLEELIGVHERISLKLSNTFHWDGILFYAWVVPGTIVVAILAILASKFVVGLPKSLRNQMITAGVVFLCGCLGMECLGGWVYSVGGGEGKLTALIANAEEFLEMAGVWLLARSLCQRLAQTRFRLAITN